jgi:hypothetical protein
MNDALTGQVDFDQKHLSGNLTYQASGIGSLEGLSPSCLYSGNGAKANF